MAGKIIPTFGWITSAPIGMGLILCCHGCCIAGQGLRGRQERDRPMGWVLGLGREFGKAD